MNPPNLSFPLIWVGPEIRRPMFSTIFWTLFRKNHKKISMKFRCRKNVKSPERVDTFHKTYEANYPMATEGLLKDLDSLLALYNFRPEHWISHLDEQFNWINLCYDSAPNRTGSGMLQQRDDPDHDVQYEVKWISNSTSPHQPLA